MNKPHSIAPEISGVLVYDINILTSYITRLYNPNISQEDIDDINTELSNILEDFSKNFYTPYIHSHSCHIEQIQKQLLHIQNFSIKNTYISVENKIKIQVFLEKYFKTLSQETQNTLHITSQKIEEIFQSPGLFGDAPKNIEQEFEKWNTQLIHPEINKFNFNLTTEQIKEIMYLAIEKILECKIPSINFHTQNTNNAHKIFWNISSEGVNYIIPGSKFSDYMSFEFPHNATHLLHLSNLPNDITSYSDSISQRSFFEGLAVLSEYTAFEKFQKTDIIQDIHNIIKTNIPDISISELQDFLIADRIFEFRLRTLRLLTDYLVMNNYSYDSIIKESKSYFSQEPLLSEREIQKYYSQPGLGGIYTHGYLRLKRAGIQNPMQIFSEDFTPKTWNESGM